MKKLAVLLVVFVLFGILLYSMGIAEEAKKVADELILGKLAKKYEPVKFPHKKHAEDFKIKCSDCHHKTPEGETPKPCGECHKPEDRNLEKAYHGTKKVKGCRSCHREMKKAGKKKATTACTKCHPKKK